MFAPSPIKKPAIRLSQDYTPSHYDIFIQPDIPAKKFRGRVEISFKENKSSDRLQLHADPTIEIESVTMNNEEMIYSHDECILDIFGNDFISAPIAISYVGSLNHECIGLYYVNEESCVTHFEPSEARKAFPCFDEPNNKSTFSITIKTLKELTAISNMPSYEVSEDGNEKITKFQKTPLMCTYLVAMAVGKFDVVNGTTRRGLPIDVYGSIGSREYLNFPLQEAIKSVEWIENYLGVNYELPRLQILGTPRFLMGGMENYGLIIIMEILLVVKENETSTQAPPQQPIGQIMQQMPRIDMSNPQSIGQGMQQVFQNPNTVNSMQQILSDQNTMHSLMSSVTSMFGGSIITDNTLSAMEKSLVDMMLSPLLIEGTVAMIRGTSLTQLSSMMDQATASLMMTSISVPSRQMLCGQIVAHEIVHMWAGDLVSPTWWDALWLNEAFATYIPSIMFDEYHPNWNFIKLYDASTDQMALILDTYAETRPIHGKVVNENDPFDLMSYNKGAKVMNMLRMFIGKDKFRSILGNYFRKFQNQSINAQDLINFFSQEAKLDLTTFFNQWVFQNGFPLIVVEDNVIRQMPFGECQNSLWTVPLKIVYGKDGQVLTKIMVLVDESMELGFEADWMIVNPGLSSFCRVWYLGDWFQKLIQVAPIQLTSVEQTILLSEQLTLQRHDFVEKEDVAALKYAILRTV